MNKRKILKEVLSYSKIILFSLLITYVVNNKLIANAQVPTSSMENTIMADSRIIINRLSYISDSPKRGDIVAFQCPDEEPDSIPYLKRIIALPGETIQGTGGKVYIDEKELPEPYIIDTVTSDFGTYTVPENCYFMMGDNRTNSWDSRFWENKYVEKNDIVGKALFEYFPIIKQLDSR